MVLVDTSVWIDFFRNRNSPQVGTLKRLLREGDDICTCGIVLTEVLQGVVDDHEHRRTATAFDAFLFLPMGRSTFLKAAEIYRTLRRQGITIGKPVDCMIAAVAIEHGVPLLHRDRDFLPLVQHCGLMEQK